MISLSAEHVIERFVILGYEGLDVLADTISRAPWYGRLQFSPPKTKFQPLAERVLLEASLFGFILLEATY